MGLLAHSARNSMGVPVQTYEKHVRNVIALAVEKAGQIAQYYAGNGDALVSSIRFTAEFHDLGKVDPINQNALADDSKLRRLPLNHVDAGVAYAMSVSNVLAAILVSSHHLGLPDLADESNRGEQFLRDRDLKDTIDKALMDYLGDHANALGTTIYDHGYPELTPFLLRIALSCLVDADHSDTASHYDGDLYNQGFSLLPDRRLVLLDRYIGRLGEGNVNKRNSLRDAIYRACRELDPIAAMYTCDSPVGTGKTTAVMAHLLRVAQQRGLRRVFVVLPFTNIIDQSVDVYRKALVSSGEDPEGIVAAHHHRAEFEDPASRQFAFLWNSPIIVTTAVQFFETLAGSRTGTLRKLHQLPGSAIFIDEAHAALPVHLWPQAWRWLRELERNWGCHFVLGSGSLNRFWELEEFSDEKVQLPELVSTQVRVQGVSIEQHRITYRFRPDVLDLDGLLEWIPEVPGPRILILNTVQSAAVVTSEICERYGRTKVEHLSTSLCPRDRKIVLDRVKERLQDERDSDWTLVATSCAEAGLDLSFRNGFRERSSLNSLIQLGGRVNRNGDWLDSLVWDFQLIHEGLLRAHPAFRTSGEVLGELLLEGHISPEYCTEAMRREIRQVGLSRESKHLAEAERNYVFPEVSRIFTVIDSDTVTAIVDPDLAARVESRAKVSSRLLQAMSVQIWRYREVEYALKPLAGHPGLYRWTLHYDEFLGYMAGVLQLLKHQLHGSII